jgi:Putative restriction endonuclease
MTTEETNPVVIEMPRRFRSQRPKRGNGLFRMPVAMYHMMLRKGIFQSGDPIELLDGLLFRKAVMTPQHAFVVQGLNEWMFGTELGDWDYHCVGAITLRGLKSEPEPDGMIHCTPKQERHRRHARPSEVAVVFEVADHSL